MTYGGPNWQPWIMDESPALPLIKHAYDRAQQDVAKEVYHGSLTLAALLPLCCSSRLTAIVGCAQSCYQVLLAALAGMLLVRYTID